MTWNETVNYLSDKMDALLEEAQEKGCCFAFDVVAIKPMRYKEGQPVVLFSDDDTFGFSVEEYKGDD